MKIRLTSFLFLFVAFAMVGIFTSCSDDDGLSNGGTPMISYVRVTRPEASDSLLTKAGQGATIAIIGENLQNARELWINDQEAYLTPTFITNTTIITTVPSEIPTEINNKMRVVFANGEEIEHDFVVDISEPEVAGMLSEYVNEGEVATITGNFFYEPLTVTFTGGAQGEIVTVEDDVVTVRVPAGAQPGPITVASNFGTTESDFWFRDNRNIIASFDGSTSGLWTGADYIVSSDDDIPNINGKFIRMNRALGAWAWFELFVGPENSSVALETKNIPADALANPGKYSLKFEINTLASLAGANIHMYIGNNMSGERGSVNYNWQPNLNTGGKWETVTIPWDNVYTANGKFANNPNGYGVSIHFSGASAVTANFGLDNMRVVPNSLP